MEDTRHSPGLPDSSPSAPKKQKLHTGGCKKSNSELAMCPKCEFMNSNLQQCGRCGTQYTKVVELVPAVFLQQTFLPNLIKTEVEDKESINSSSSISSSTHPAQVEYKKEQELCEIPNIRCKPLKKPNADCKNNTLEKRTRQFEISLSSLNDLSAQIAKPFVKFRLSPKQTIVEETLINENLKVLRLLQIQPDSLLNFPFTVPTYSEGVEKLIFDFYCPLKLFPDFLNRFRDAHSIQIGSDFFVNSQEGLKNEDIQFFPPAIPWTHVHSLVIKTDILKLKFKQLQESHKSEAIARSFFLLKFATVGLPCLSHCNISFPYSPELEEAIKILIAIKFQSDGGGAVLKINKRMISLVVGTKPEIPFNSSEETLPFESTNEPQCPDISDSDVVIIDEVPTSAKEIEEILVSSDVEEEEQSHLRSETNSKCTPISTTEQTCLLDSVNDPLSSLDPPISSFVSALSPSPEELSGKNDSCVKIESTTIQQDCQSKNESPVSSFEDSTNQDKDVSACRTKGNSEKNVTMSGILFEKTIIEETFINKQLKILRLLRIQPNFLLNFPFRDPNYSEGVEKLIFDSICPLKSFLDLLDRFHDVHSIQIGSDFLLNSNENLEKGLVHVSSSPLHWTNIQSLEIIPEIKKFSLLPEEEKSQAIVRSLTILKLAITGFPSLSHCNVCFPYTPEVAEAVDILISTKFLSKGRKVIDFSTNEISFTHGVKVNSSQTCDENETFTLRTSIDPHGSGINIEVPTKPQTSESPHSEEEAKAESTIIDDMDTPSQFHQIKCEGVRVGDYKSSPSLHEGQESSTPKVILTISKDGLFFHIPHSTDRHRTTRIGIPHEAVLSLKVFFDNFQSFIFILTTADFAKWVRSVLGLTDNLCSSRFYCPSTGANCQKLIVFTSKDRNLRAELFLEIIFESSYEELDYLEVEELLAQIKCHGHQ